METPRADLYRMVAPATALDISDGRNFTGYAAVFDSPTEIDSWEGRFTEVFSQGAFRKTLAERADKVKFLYDHGFDPSLGNKPIGTLEALTEDARGLRVSARMLDTTYADDITKAIAAGALDGMSFRFSVVRDEWDDTTEIPIRTVKEAKLHEVSVVTFPAYAATEAGVRSRQAYEAWRAQQHDTGTTTATVEGFDAADTGTSTVNEAPPTGAPFIDEARLERAEKLRRVRALLT